MLKVLIKDFEIIEDARLELEGLVAFVGESNNGKTAIYNSIYVGTYNIQGVNYIRRVQGKPVPNGTKVGMWFDEGTVIFEKAQSPVYKLQVGDTKQVFDKAGRGPTPQDVAELLNMSILDVDGTEVNLNFVPQLSEPLLMKLSEGLLYKLVVKSFDGEKIQEAISLCNTDILAKDKEIKLKEVEIDVQKKHRLQTIEKQEKYEGLETVSGEIDTYRKSINDLEILLGLVGKYTELKGKIETLEKEEPKLKVITNIHVALQKVQASWGWCEWLKAAQVRYTNITGNIGKMDDRLSLYDGFGVVTLSKEKYLENVKGLKHVLDLLNAGHNIQARLDWRLREEECLVNIPNIGDVKEKEKTLENLQKQDDKLLNLSNRVIVLGKQLVCLETVPNTGDVSKKEKQVQAIELYRVKLEGLRKREFELTNEYSNVEEQRVALQGIIDRGECVTCGRSCKCNIKTE